MGSVRQQWLPAIFSLAALLLITFGSPEFRRRETDFLSFYAGARLVGTPDLFRPESAYAIQQQVSHPQRILPYLRPPFYAALLWPFGRLPYTVALTVWLSLNLAALGAFIALWWPNRISVILCAWFLPVWVNMAAGQDDTLMLACIAAGFFLLRRGWGLQSGLVLSLCAIKFQLFFLLPLFLVAHRLWRTMLGFGLGAVALLLISFAAAGPHWPVEYLSILQLADRIDPIGKMPNLYGLFHGVPGAPVCIAVFSAVILVAVWRVIRRSSLDYGLALTILGSVLISMHAYLYDCMLLLPLFLVLTRELGFHKVMPIYIGLTLGIATLPLPKLHLIGQFTLLAFFCWAAIGALRAKQSAAAPPG
jgi:hypothetical protein